MQNNAHPIDLARVAQETWLDRIHFFDQIDSTNNAALAHAAQDNQSHTELFLAERQTGGRGRGSNQWWSSPGALTWSVLTKPIETPVSHLPQVSLTMGLAICQVVEQFVAGDVTLKWPNDVYLNGRKAAGILIELPAANPKRLVIGVGLNVNNPIREAPAELQTTAISLVDAGGHHRDFFDRTAVLIECMQQVERHLSRFADADPSLPDAWRQRSLLTGRQICLAKPRHEVRGVCEGVADDGALVVRTSSGVEHCYGGVVTEFT